MDRGVRFACLQVLHRVLFPHLRELSCSLDMREEVKLFVEFVQCFAHLVARSDSPLSFVFNKETKSKKQKVEGFCKQLKQER